MKTDIYHKLEIDFRNDLAEAIEQISTLEVESKGNISDRLLRAIIF